MAPSLKVANFITPAQTLSSGYDIDHAFTIQAPVPSTIIRAGRVGLQARALHSE